MFAAVHDPWMVVSVLPEESLVLCELRTSSFCTESVSVIVFPEYAWLDRKSKTT